MTNAALTHAALTHTALTHTALTHTVANTVVANTVVTDPVVTDPVVNESVLSGPVSVLLEEPNPILRSRAHLALAQRALDSGNFEVASDHLHEAASLDPTDETPRRLLQQIRDGRGATRSRRRPSWWPF